MADLRQRLQTEADDLLSDAFADSSRASEVYNLVSSLISDLPSEEIEEYLSTYFHVHEDCEACGEALEGALQVNDVWVLWCTNVDCEE